MLLAEATKVGYKIPVLMDDKQIIGESLGVTRSAEAIVIDGIGFSRGHGSLRLGALRPSRVA